MCKKDIVIVNTSRGEVINEKDIINHLYENPYSIYATDEFQMKLITKKKVQFINISKNNIHLVTLS